MDSLPSKKSNVCWDNMVANWETCFLRFFLTQWSLHLFASLTISALKSTHVCVGNAWFSIAIICWGICPMMQRESVEAKKSTEQKELRLIGKKAFKC